MTTKDDFEARCPSFQAAIELVGRRWNGAILMAAQDGARRYSEYLAAVPGISDRVLAQRLRELDAAEVLVREVQPTTPVQITYSLTDRGKELALAVQPLVAWGERWLGRGTEDDG
ncbi:HxlR family transcriptional regulator [Planotetraspora silvatica]|uniref:HxlR family transcriptional regulator n=1 Tax=Planotetraspora silvatica TaxID=234614 RepID=A0A8J3USI4_9ACTN|nr:helix-turn-helix domain-containing protein [Planotetraspora silvatica]GII50543.1 HxlR family transcriptional regulator [Planotetraspora silvatica]